VYFQNQLHFESEVIWKSPKARQL